MLLIIRLRKAEQPGRNFVRIWAILSLSLFKIRKYKYNIAADTTYLLFVLSNYLRPGARGVAGFTYGRGRKFFL